MEKLIFVSADGHAVVPPDLWPEYLEKKYQKYLDRLRRESKLFSGSMQMLSNLRMSEEAAPVFDRDGVYAAGQWRGVSDRDVRLSEMDREGVAAEFVFPGDFRASDLFFSTMNGSYAIDAVDAGVRAFNRWAHDAFGPAKERFLLIGAAGTCRNLDATIDEANWMADHGFAGVFTPGFCAFPGMLPLYDLFWDRLWASYAERGLVLITHGGFGADQGFAYGEMDAAAARVAARSGNDKDLVEELTTSVFNREFFSDLRCRQSLWQMMLGGVFDRHPKLKLMMTEVRGDWIPATLKLLDKMWEKNRNVLPAKRRPSDYWRTNCMTGLSFMHKAEVEMRHEIGLSTVSFGRDYPHTEGTWPNTTEYLRGLFRGVPEAEVRAILGENLIRFLGLDRAKLTKIAARIGPSYELIAGPGPEVDPALIAHLDARCGYLAPAEGSARVDEMEALLTTELRRIGAASMQVAAR
jgi:hypothetical protein